MLTAEPSVPASITATVTDELALSLFAITNPAVPPPTMTAGRRRINTISAQNGEGCGPDSP